MDMWWILKKSDVLLLYKEQNMGIVLEEQNFSRRALFLGNTATCSNTRTCCQSATYPSHAPITLPLFVKDNGMQVVSLNERPTEYNKMCSASLFMQQPLAGQRLLIIAASRSRSDTPHSVGFLCTSDQPEAEISSWKNTTFKKTKHPCHQRDSNSQSQQANGRRPKPQSAWPLRSAFVLLPTYLLHGAGPSWEANRFSTSQEVPRILWNPKVHYRIHKCPPPAPILNHTDPLHALRSHLLKIHLNIILPSMPGFSKWSLSLRFPHQNPVYTSTFAHTCYMPRPPHSLRFDHPNNIGWIFLSLSFLKLHEAFLVL